MLTGVSTPMSENPRPARSAATDSLGRGVILSMTEMGKATFSRSFTHSANPLGTLPAAVHPSTIVRTESRSLSPLWLKLSHDRRVIGAPPAS